ncbi:long-chain fatty acid--CoA ligase [uncultured Candidatus Pelagibacter sp.]|jgi:long-chain acyl-CoA synthetase|uniref:AMP-dependent synthetase/ligase n=1 Tax=uncultured Candidatus Pelagibacter sp. TaxID=372654 RepID=UPI00230AC1C5|nr:long-chain fatty acid--CoA ligase [uncultured Candidatus Pelagibacter sp.]MDA7587581.1 long-chain fatty acid--CoA ligase [Candidatus Pelagibacter sp.]MDB3969941.1 long-chain fatty acid--CoA ligase [Candidatus Pelagibacter sp.]
MNLDNTNNLIELFSYQAEKQNKKSIFLQWLNPKNKKTYTWEETQKNILKLSKIIKKNIKEGDRCLLVSENRPEWFISDMAIMLSGGITVPAYTTYTEEDYKYLIEDCEPSLVIVSNNEMLKKLSITINEKKFIKKVITLDEVNKVIYNLDIINRDKYLDFNIILNNDLLEEDKIKNDKLKRTSPACIIYTSGTGGNPKGVILSHGGILNNLVGACEIMKPLFSSKPIFLTWLPLSHSYEHCVQFAQIAVGAKVFYAEKIEKLLENISEAKPTIMTAVPRFYQNLYNKININLKKQTGFKAKLIEATLRLGKKKLLNQKMTFSEKLLNFMVEILVRKKIKKQFGGKLKAFVSGGGALDKEIGEFLNSVGLPTLQGYGLTETSPVVSCNPIHKIKVETVGPPFRGNQVKIADDGEILVKGENVMLGYWNKKKETDEVIIDGWLHTGDIGEIDPEDGYLKITDRKKDIIVSAGGDNISPAKIENIITNEPEIDQCMVYGDKKNYLVALIVPSKDFLKEKEQINNVIEKINKKLTLLEKIKRIQLIDENFSIENGLMTPTMKVKRKKVTEKYKIQLEKLY